MFSCAVGRGKHHKQISLAFVGSDCSVWATLSLPPLMVCVLSRSKVGPGLCALPRSKLLRFRFSGTPQRHRIGWALFCALPRSKQLRPPGAWQGHSPQVGGGGVSYHLPHASCSVSWVYSRYATSGVLCVSSGELISGFNPLGRCQPSRIPESLG